MTVSTSAEWRGKDGDVFFSTRTFDGGVNIVKGVEYSFHCVGKKGCLCKPICGEIMRSNMIQLYQLTNDVQLYEIVVS